MADLIPLSVTLTASGPQIEYPVSELHPPLERHAMMRLMRPIIDVSINSTDLKSAAAG